MAGIRDTRKVQTAVVGAARSRDPVQMPESRYEAVRFRSDHAHRSFWCGTWLGGCGKRLTTRVGRVRVPHFAHYPEFPERHVCQRRHTDSASADHLYLSRDLERWLVSHGRGTPAVDLRGDFSTGGTCHQAVLTTRDAQGRISLEFVPDIAEKWEGAWRTRLFGPRQRPPAELLKRQGHVLRARLGTDTGRYRTEIGTVTPGNPVQWSNLDQCVLTDRGLTTPHMPEPPRPEAGKEDVPALQVFGLPLDTGEILAYPRGPRSTDHTASELSGHPHRLAVYLASEAGAEDAKKVRRAGHLWLPDPVSGVATGEPHRITGPAWADLERSVPEQWSVRARGLVPVKPKPPAAPPVPEPVAEQLEEPASGGPEPAQSEPEPSEPAPSEPEPSEPTSALADENPAAEEGQSSLIDPGPVFDAAPLTDSLIDWAEEAGWPVSRNRSARRWLTLALMHRSRVYETRGLSDGHSEALGVLDLLGRRWLAVCLMDLFVRELVPSGVGGQSSWLNDIQGQVIGQMALWPQIGDHLLLGGGEESSGGRGKQGLRSQAVLQLLGAMALHGRFETVRTLVERAYRQSSARSGALRGSQWVTLLDRELGTGTYEHRYTSSGPDHATEFRATLVDSAGRAATGAGRSKAEAKGRAARAYAERYLPEAVRRAGGQALGQGVDRRAPGTGPLVPRVYRDLPDEHHRVVGRLRALLALPRSAEGWIVQALTHSSWAHENRSKMLSAAQKDNTLLAHHGSLVGQLLHAHHRATRLFERTLEPTSEEARLATPEAGMWQDMLHRVGASGSLLKSRGAIDPGKAARADAMQALVAVFWREHGPAALDMLPEEFVQGLREQSTGLDPVTLLQSFCAQFGIGWEVRHQQSGPVHLRSHRAELLLGAAGEQVVIRGALVEGAKKNATKAVARTALDVIDRIGAAGEWDLGEEQLPLARALLVAQVARAPELRGKKLLACTRDGHLGLGFLRGGDLRAFAAWAEQAEAVHGEFTDEQLNGLMGLYERAVRSSPEEGSPVLRGVLRRLAARVTDVAGGGAVSEEDRQVLTALDRYRRLGALPSAVGEADGEIALVPDTPEETGPRVLYGPSLSGTHLGVSPREATCLAVIVGALCPAGSGASVAVAQDESGVLVAVANAERPLPLTVGALADLITDAVPTFTFDPGEGEQECTFEVTPADRVDSLVQAGAWALRNTFRPPEQLGRVLALSGVLFTLDPAQERGLDEEELEELRGELAGMTA